MPGGAVDCSEQVFGQDFVMGGRRGTGLDVGKRVEDSDGRDGMRMNGLNCDGIGGARTEPDFAADVSDGGVDGNTDLRGSSELRAD